MNLLTEQQAGMKETGRFRILSLSILSAVHRFMLIPVGALPDNAKELDKIDRELAWDFVNDDSRSRFCLSVNGVIESVLS